MTREQVSVDFRTDRVGEWSPDATAAVTRTAIAAYASATGETDSRALAGDLSTLVFGVVPSWQLVAGLFRSVIPDEHWNRVVHGEHAIESARPLVPGDELTTRASVRSIRPVSTGTLVDVEILSHDAAGHLVVRQLSTSFTLGVIARGATGPSAATAPTADEEAPVEFRVPTDPGLPARYAEASGDRSAIHLDDDAARAIGLPGVILHGMCSLALGGRAIVEVRGDRDPFRLRSLACRFSGLARPGDDLVLQVGGSGFAAASPAGHPVLGKGTFTLGDPVVELPRKDY
jgi:acyl dehydratase